MLSDLCGKEPVGQASAWIRQSSWLELDASRVSAAGQAMANWRGAKGLAIIPPRHFDGYRRSRCGASCNYSAVQPFPSGARGSLALPNRFNERLRTFHAIDKCVCKFRLFHLLVCDRNNAAAGAMLSESFRQKLSKRSRQ
jgi:hypothetical protein